MNNLLNSDAWFLITTMEKGTDRILSTKLCSESYIPTHLMQYSEMMLDPHFGGVHIQMDALDRIIFIEKLVIPRKVVDSRWKN